jgi:hypothetical protein
MSHLKHISLCHSCCNEDVFNPPTYKPRRPVALQYTHHRRSIRCRNNFQGTVIGVAVVRVHEQHGHILSRNRDTFL